jgi:hypothetical protein
MDASSPIIREMSRLTKRHRPPEDGGFGFEHYLLILSAVVVVWDSKDGMKKRKW